MKRVNKMTGLIAAAALLAAPFVGCGGGAEADLPPVTPVNNPGYDKDAPTESAVQSSNSLGVAMYHQLAKAGEEGDNLFFSPISISAALMMTYEGARSQTLKEFETVLTLEGGNRPAAHKAYAGVLGRLSGEDKPYALAVANALWGEQSMPFSDAFLEAVQAHYAASFESVDFKAGFEAQRKRINGWVSERTEKRINDLLPEGSLSNMTRLVLVNAIYFKAPWSNEFNERATKDEPFHLLPAKPGDEGTSVKVPMMRHGEERFPYADLQGYDALKMYYKGGDLSMVVLLPDEKDGLTGLEKKLSAQMIDETVDALKRESVNLWLPKWETTRGYNLKPALKELGMPGAFAAGSADFTGLSDSAEAEQLFISGVFHKAFIAVDEEGTEAAAATAVAAETLSAPLRPEKVYDFRCDRPFVYLIRDERTGAILFMGRVTDPS